MASSSMFDDHMFNRTSIILEKQSDWKLWYSMKKQYATAKGVWEYCDPSTTIQPPTVDDMPQDTDPESTWRKWEIKTNAQKSILKAIGEVNLEIMRTVACSKLHIISDLELDIRLRLKTLQDYFKITNQQQTLKLSSQYTDKVQQKQKHQSTENRLKEYSRVSSLCKVENMAEMKDTRPQWAFIRAVQAQGDSNWSIQHISLMIECEEDEKPPPTLEGLINRYRRWVSFKQLHTTTLGSFETERASPPTLKCVESKKNHAQCVCGLYHRFLRCYVLNSRAGGRPEGFKPSRKALRKILDAFKNVELLKKVKKLFKDNNIPWTFYIAKASAEVQN